MLPLDEYGGLASRRSVRLKYKSVATRHQTFRRWSGGNWRGRSERNVNSLKSLPALDRPHEGGQATCVACRKIARGLRPQEGGGPAWGTGGTATSSSPTSCCSPPRRSSPTRSASKP